MYWGFDPLFLYLVLPAIALSLWASFKVKGSFKKFSKERTTNGMTGAEAAREVLRNAGISDVRIEKVAGHLTDHFDPRDNTIRLSESVYSQANVAAVGVAAHEAGHAIQHAEGYSPLAIRSAIVPVAGIGSRIAPFLIIIGFWMEMFGLVNIGIILMGAVVLFHLVTLPVEFNASSRAQYILEGTGILTGYELEGSRKVLNAAAFTYVAALIVALAQLLRFVAMARRR
ncbi:MAG: zinc metallopeptidase [Defluviitaleaceae bacterium]|nr:zinc metallopeptidase [Defluviitaleaceae bacterium]